MCDQFRWKLSHIKDPLVYAGVEWYDQSAQHAQTDHIIRCPQIKKSVQWAYRINEDWSAWEIQIGIKF